MKKNLAIIFFISPFFSLAQENINGLWRLIETHSFSGPAYDNGVPKSINIKGNNSEITIGYQNKYGEKDTIEWESLQIGMDKKNEIITLSKRKRSTTFNWDQVNKKWLKASFLSAKEDFDRTEIKITETFNVSHNGEEVLILTKKYDGVSAPGGNADFVMQGVYEKTTPEKIARDTATGNGINFREGLTWSQLLEKAKNENKFVFVDCYATWCLPCKKMEKEVYNLNVIGEAMNDKFICVKVQMDTSKKDGKSVKLTYPIARKLEEKYEINALPTFLFFDSHGLPVHKGIGAYTYKNFLKLAEDARDPSKQIYTLIRKAVARKLSNDQLRVLVTRLDVMGEKELASKMAREYFEQFLYRLNEKELFTKENMEFYANYVRAIRVDDKIFNLFLKNPGRIDSLSGMKKGFSSGLVESVITQEEIQPFFTEAIKAGTVPPWTTIEEITKKKYGNWYAYLTVVNAKVVWYRKTKEWKLYLENLINQLDILGDLKEMHWLMLNSAAWDVFEHSEDKKQLEKALSWSNTAIRNHIADTTIQKVPWGSILDTYANLLYKLGRRDEAIKFYQDKILSIGRVQSIDLYETYVKIFAGTPTWPHKE